jgi:prepilin-type N-terminal cleavage/methylation domain-containing protein
MALGSTSHRKAFTLLELIIVVILIGIMSAMVFPRLVGNRSREFNLIVEKVADVVLMFAHRNATSNQPAAIRFDSEVMQFELLAKVKEDGERFWKLDPLATPIKLPTWLEEDALEIYVDGEFTDTSVWPITAAPGESRPLIEVRINWDSRTAVISLPPHAIGPSVWIDDEGTEPMMPIDLDAEGRGQEEW